MGDRAVNRLKRESFDVYDPKNLIENTTHADGSNGFLGNSSEDDSLKNWSNEINSPISAADLVRDQIECLKSEGPTRWDSSKGAWRWKEPANVVYDPQRKMYVKEQQGIDPLLRLDGFKQTMLELRRMGAMCRAGRIYYYRVLTLVGNGRGLFGFGVGFGNTPKDARKDAAAKAVQRLERIDLDE